MQITQITTSVIDRSRERNPDGVRVIRSHVHTPRQVLNLLLEKRVALVWPQEAPGPVQQGVQQPPEPDAGMAAEMAIMAGELAAAQAALAAAEQRAAAAEVNLCLPTHSLTVVMALGTCCSSRGCSGGSSSSSRSRRSPGSRRGRRSC